MKGSTVPIRKNRPSVLVWKGLAWERKTEDWLAPVSGVVTSDCGKRENPLLHKQELHDGLDIAVAEGTEVVAVKSGRVTEVRTSRRMASCCDLKQRTGIRFYMHTFQRYW